MGKPEAKVENYLVQEAAKHGLCCFKTVSPGTNGFPDRTLIGHGKVIFVECKAPGKTPRKSQLYLIKQLEEHGACVYVIDTKDQVDLLMTNITPKKG